MKKLVGIAVFAAALMVGAIAQAAAINVIATRGDYLNPGGDKLTWALTIDTTVGVGAIAINVPTGTTFTINTLNTAIATFGNGSSFSDAATPGLSSLNLNQAAVGGAIAPAGGSSLIGTFLAATALDTLITPDDDSVGGTVFNTALGIIPSDQWALVNRVPEPTAAVLLGFGLAALGLVRRKAA
jgi:hypothetical protein